MHSSIKRSTRSVLTGAAIALGAAMLALPPGATADPGDELGAACSVSIQGAPDRVPVNGHPGAVGKSGNASYAHGVRTAPTDGTANGGDQDENETTTTAFGLFMAQFDLMGPSCLGIDYVLTVTTADGQGMGWSTATAPSKGRVGGAQATTAHPDLATATFTWAGDGQSDTFGVTGTTFDNWAECLWSSIQAVRPDGKALFSKEIYVCDGTAGGTSYF